MEDRVLPEVKALLAASLQLNESTVDALREDSALLGGLPEFDSMAVVAVLTMIEEEFSVTIHDDEVSAQDFETVGSLVRFLEAKTRG
jgi:acyl carrier protein